MMFRGTQKKWRETQIPLGGEGISKKGGVILKRGGKTFGIEKFDDVSIKPPFFKKICLRHAILDFKY